MNTVGGLIIFAVVGAYICAKSRAPGGAVVFALVAAVLFLSTPVGSHIPTLLALFVDAVDEASSPTLTDTTTAVWDPPQADAEPVG